MSRRIPELITVRRSGESRTCLVWRSRCASFLFRTNRSSDQARHRGCHGPTSTRTDDSAHDDRDAGIHSLPRDGSGLNWLLAWTAGPSCQNFFRDASNSYLRCAPKTVPDRLPRIQGANPEPQGPPTVVRIARPPKMQRNNAGNAKGGPISAIKAEPNSRPATRLRSMYGKRGRMPIPPKRNGTTAPIALTIIDVTIRDESCFWPLQGVLTPEIVWPPRYPTAGRQSTTRRPYPHQPMPTGARLELHGMCPPGCSG